MDTVQRNLPKGLEVGTDSSRRREADEFREKVFIELKDFANVSAGAVEGDCRIFDLSCAVKTGYERRRSPAVLRTESEGPAEIREARVDVGGIEEVYGRAKISCG